MAGTGEKRGAKLWWENLKEKKCLEDLGIDGMTVNKIEILAFLGCCVELVGSLLPTLLDVGNKLPVNSAKHPAGANTWRRSGSLNSRIILKCVFKNSEGSVWTHGIDKWRAFDNTIIELHILQNWRNFFH
jgi:hypothetical protein